MLRLLEDQRIFLEEIGIDPDNVSDDDLEKLWDLHDNAQGSETETAFSQVFIRELVKRLEP